MRSHLCHMPPVILGGMEPNKNPIGIIGLSQELRLPIKWLKEQADAGRIPSLLIGKKRLYNVAAVRAALAQMAANSPIPDQNRRSVLGDAPQ